MGINGDDMYNAGFVLALFGCLLYEETLTVEDARAKLAAKGITESELKVTALKFRSLIEYMVKEEANV